MTSEQEQWLTGFWLEQLQKNFDEVKRIRWVKQYMREHPNEVAQIAAKGGVPCVRP